MTDLTSICEWLEENNLHLVPEQIITSISGFDPTVVFLSGALAQEDRLVLREQVIGRFAPGDYKSCCGRFQTNEDVNFQIIIEESLEDFLFQAGSRPPVGEEYQNVRRDH